MFCSLYSKKSTIQFKIAKFWVFDCTECHIQIDYPFSNLFKCNTQIVSIGYNNCPIQCICLLKFIQTTIMTVFLGLPCSTQALMSSKFKPVNTYRIIQSRFFLSLSVLSVTPYLPIEHQWTYHLNNYVKSDFHLISDLFLTKWLFMYLCCFLSIWIHLPRKSNKTVWIVE